MSQWTHVNAAIRFDGVLGMGLPTQKELGKICKWEDEDTSHWDNPELPCGSEGSIEYTIVKTGSENSMACMAVIFTGDLRHYDNAEEILEYFKRITSGKMVRSGILEIDIEFQDTIIYQFDNNDEILGWVERCRIKPE